MADLTREDFLKLDRKDQLAPFREEFYIPEGVIYMDGNSLGVMPKAASKRIREVTDREWGHDLIKSWNMADCFNAPRRIGDKIAKIIGAEEGEIVTTDSAGINLFKAISAALAINSDRSVIVMEGSNFPTDNYIAQGLIEFLGRQHQIRFVEKDSIMEAIEDNVAVVSLTDVHYKTNHLLDMKVITAKAHQHGALTVWDLCHSAGAIPIDLNGANADFAVGCGYKYLNGGPGAPSFIFVAKRHHAKLKQPLTGWWSHRSRFDFTRDYEIGEGINRMLCGTQPIISLSALEVGVDIMTRADIHKIRQKSKKMGDLFIAAVEQKCGDYGFGIASPRNADKRGSQVSLTHENSYAIMCQAVDSRNHFLTSLLVCGGILLASFAQLWNAPWLFYADAVASAIIGLMILRSAIELVQELLKEPEEKAEVSHFMKRTGERIREKMLLKWLAGQLQSGSLTGEELKERFTNDFCEQTPKILILSGMGYRPESGEDLHRYLELFVEQKKLVLDECKYWLLARS